MDDFRALIHRPSDLTLQLTGVGPHAGPGEQSEKELVQAETVSFPSRRSS
jgi:hypothetical protein